MQTLTLGIGISPWTRCVIDDSVSGTTEPENACASCVLFMHAWGRLTFASVSSRLLCASVRQGTNEHEKRAKSLLPLQVRVE